MHNPFTRLSGADRAGLLFLILDVAGSVLLGVTQDSLAGLPPRQAAIGFALLAGALSVLLVEIAFLVLENQSLSPVFLLIGAGCLLAVTFGPYGFVSVRFYQTVSKWLASEERTEGFHLTPLVATPPPAAPGNEGTGEGAPVIPTKSNVPMPATEPAAAKAEPARPDAPAAPAHATAQPTSCTAEPQGEFGTIWRVERLGCPAGPERQTWAAWEEFEHGAMFWREDTEVIYVLQDKGTWVACRDEWQDGTPDSDPGLSPPSGRYQPTRGIGKAWRERDGVRAGLGWAVEPEQGMCVTVQDFPGEALLLRYSQAEQGCLAPDGYNPPGRVLGIVLRPDGSWTSYR